MTDTPTRVDGWQPIETAREGQRVLVTDGVNVTMSQRNPHGIWWQLRGDKLDFDGVKLVQLVFKPTHWMPLPEAPQ